jgi:hypothetical protein
MPLSKLKKNINLGWRWGIHMDPIKKPRVNPGACEG